MELEKAQSNLEQSPESITIVSLGEKAQESMLLVRRLLSEASSSYPQLSQLHFLPIPLPLHKLEIWNYWLAAELIAQWRNLPVENGSVGAMINELGFIQSETTLPILAALDKTVAGTLSSELATRIDAIRSEQSQWQLFSPNLQKWIARKAAQLSDWYSKSDVPSAQDASDSCLAQLQFNVLALRSKQRLQLQKFFVLLQQAGSRSAIKSLQTLEMILTRLSEDYETKRQQCLQREDSAWRAYHNLSMQLKQRRLLLSRLPTEGKAVVEAMAKAYNFKLEAEIYFQVCQLVNELRQQVQLQVICVTGVDKFLHSLQNWFIEHCLSEPIFAPILKKYLMERIDILKLQQEIEDLVGCTLNQWCTLNVTEHQVLCQQILARLKPLCLEIYAECYYYLVNLDVTEIPSCLLEPTNTN